MTPRPDPDQSATVWHVSATARRAAVDGITAAIQRLAEAQADIGVTVRILGPPAPVAFPRRAGALLAQERPDLVHFHSVFRPAHAVLAARLRTMAIPYVTSPHSGLSPLALRRQRRRKDVYSWLVERRFIHGAAGVSCLTDLERDDVARFVPGYRGHLGVVPNTLSPELLGPPRWAPAGGRPTIVTLARFDVRQKGLDRLAGIARRCPEIDFVVYGAPDHNQPHRARRLESAAPPNLRFRPPVLGEDKIRTLAGATMFALPSRWEGLSIALMEAMAIGVPCAVSDYVARTQPVKSAGLGLVLDPDLDIAADHLRRAVAFPERLREWSIAAAAYAEHTFAPTTVARTQAALYRSALASACDGRLATAADLLPWAS